MKRNILLILIALLPMVASAYDVEIDEIDGICYNFSENKAEVTSGGAKYSGDVVIPSSVTYNGTTYTVTSIGEEAFVDCEALTSVIIPKGVTNIAKDAFQNCSGLKSLKVEEGNTVFDSRDNCNAIIETATNTLIKGCMNTFIPKSVTGIGDGAFWRCKRLTSITIPNSVTNIGYNIFFGCSGLTSIKVEGGNTMYDSRNNCNAVIETATNTLIAGCQNTVIPENVSSISTFAFRFCSSLKSINIPANVNSIGEMAFAGCSGLTSIKIEEGNTKYDSRNNCNAIIETATNKLVTGCLSTVIPKGVTSIGRGAFAGCGSLTSINIPNSVTKIGEYAFFGCDNLESIKLPNNVTNIGFWTFRGCSSLKSIKLPNSITNIGSEAFLDCSSLKSIKLPNNVTNVGSWAFYDCSGLKSIKIPNSVASIGANAFEGTTWYNSQPDGMVYAGKVIYRYKGEMPDGTQITIKDGISGIAGNAFYGCNGLTSVTIPEGVTSIGKGAFSGCSGLTSIKIEEGNTRYDSRDNCNAIIETATNTLIAGCQSTVIPEGVTNIGNNAFNGCSGLTSVNIPEGVKSIGDCAFRDCFSLTDVYCFAKDIPETMSDPIVGTFKDTPIEKATLHVPAASVGKYKATSPWSRFGKIVAK